MATTLADELIQKLGLVPYGAQSPSTSMKRGQRPNRAPLPLDEVHDICQRNARPHAQ